MLLNPSVDAVNRFERYCESDFSWVGEIMQRISKEHPRIERELKACLLDRDNFLYNDQNAQQEAKSHQLEKSKQDHTQALAVQKTTPDTVRAQQDQRKVLGEKIQTIQIQDLENDLRTQQDIQQTRASYFKARRQLTEHYTTLSEKEPHNPEHLAQLDARLQQLSEMEERFEASLKTRDKPGVKELPKETPTETKAPLQKEPVETAPAESAYPEPITKQHYVGHHYEGNTHENVSDSFQSEQDFNLEAGYIADQELSREQVEHYEIEELPIDDSLELLESPSDRPANFLSRATWNTTMFQFGAGVVTVTTETVIYYYVALNVLQFDKPHAALMAGIPFVLTKAVQYVTKKKMLQWCRDKGAKTVKRAIRVCLLLIVINALCAGTLNLRTLGYERLLNQEYTLSSQIQSQQATQVLLATDDPYRATLQQQIDVSQKKLEITQEKVDGYYTWFDYFMQFMTVGILSLLMVVSGSFLFNLSAFNTYALQLKKRIKKLQRAKSRLESIYQAVQVARQHMTRSKIKLTRLLAIKEWLEVRIAQNQIKPKNETTDVQS